MDDRVLLETREVLDSVSEDLRSLLRGGGRGEEKPLTLPILLRVLRVLLGRITEADSRSYLFPFTLSWNLLKGACPSWIDQSYWRSGCFL